jgi:cytochrome c556
MRKLVLALSSMALVTSAAWADPITDRKAVMKERGGLVGGLAPVAKGEKAFDAAAVLTSLQALDANAKKWDVDVLFPAGSESGDTKASPKIWEDMAGFKAAFAKMEKESKAAQGSVKDLDSFKTAFGAMGKECGACHEVYRIKK